MTREKKARMVAQLCALQFGIDQRKAKALISFWLDAEVVSPGATVAELAHAMQAAMKGDA
jgi:hypothetical protein